MAFFIHQFGRLYPAEFGAIHYFSPVPVIYCGRQICRTTPDKITGDCHIEDGLPEVFELLMQNRMQIQPIFDHGPDFRLVELQLVPKPAVASSK